jgi:hypothetical protein
MKRRSKSNPTKKSPAEGKLKKHISVADDPACGMWADREDMKDVAACVRRLRAPRYTFGPDGPICKPDRPKPACRKS